MKKNNMLAQKEINTLKEFGETVPSVLSKKHSVRLLEILQRTKKMRGGKINLTSSNRGIAENIPIENLEIMIFPFTNLLFNYIFNENSPSFHTGATKPLENVNWLDCVIIANNYANFKNLEPTYYIPSEARLGLGESDLANKLSLEISLINKDSWRLPIEAEWEFMAGLELDDIDGWFAENSNWQTHPVGQKKPNSNGLYDMFGNTWDWCWNWLFNYDQLDPNGFDVIPGVEKTGKGGCWYHDKPECFPNVIRSGLPASFCNSHGVRLVRNTQ
jgi:hypothetical protein